MTDREAGAVDRFLCRLKWETCTDGDPGSALRKLSIDVFSFRFAAPLDRDVQYAMLEYLGTLDLADAAACGKLCIWLAQHGVGFRLRFRWCRTRSVRYNLAMLPVPGRLYRKFRSLYDAVLDYDLSADQTAVRRN